MDGALHVADPASEQINNPSNRYHYWRYRMHVYVEDLVSNSAFCDQVRDMVRASGRLRPF
jgi:4-alpha-glucanotransferase